VVERERSPVCSADSGCSRTTTGMRLSQCQGLSLSNIGIVLTTRFITFTKIGSGMSYEDYEWILYVHPSLRRISLNVKDET
jgi:hypothetical protein